MVCRVATISRIKMALSRTVRRQLLYLLLAATALVAGCGGGGGDGGAVEGTATLTTYRDLSDLVDRFTLPPQDADGWSILTPSADSQLIYVSSSEGDDATAKAYLPADAEIGADPFAPAGAIFPYATIDAALAQVRAGYPDYILLKRGDSWDRSSSIWLRAGRSVAEKAVLAAYGSGSDRPLVKNGGLVLSKASYAAVVGIHFAATRRNPASPDFVGFDNVTNVSGFNLLSGYNGTVVGGVLIEDCWFDWFAGNVVQSAPDHGGVFLTDIIIRRNVITDNYSTMSHSQGLFSAWASILLEENVFDHNGWYQQGSGNTQADGMATMFNHNTYFAETADTLFRNNIFSRAASCGTKFTSNTSSGVNQELSWDVWLDDNFYVEGEVGISMGGNDDQDNGPRWRNIHVTNNVMTHIGRSHPTGRSLGWGLDIDDWDAGLVQGNIFTTWGDADTLRNTYAINAQGHTTNVTYQGNIAYNIVCGSSLVKFGNGAIHHGTTFVGNALQTDYAGRLLAYDMGNNTLFADNAFSSAADPTRWFSVGGQNYSTLDDYRAATGDTTSVAAEPAYVDPDRTLETYLASLGYATDMDSFAAELRQQSKAHWRPELTAHAINNYFRAGFATH